MSVIDDKEQTLVWSNDDNKEIYENMPIAYMQKLAKEIGIESGQELEHIRSYIESSKSMMEFGCGYGRVIKKAREINPFIEITAVERNQKMIQHIVEHFNDVDVIQENILNVKISKKFDLILMSWGTFCEFDKCEQEKILYQANKLLKSGGCFVFDIVLFQENHPYGNFKTNKLIIKTKYGIDILYIPTSEYIKKISLDTNLTITDEFTYSTLQGLKRHFFILQKTEI